jgi:glycosyltransferase involved in cell wall biosynthesis
MLKPNFVKTNGGPLQPRDNSMLFVGRLCKEKGIETLLAAWKVLAGKVPLKIVGDGPLLSMVAQFSNQIPDITCMGRQSSDKVNELMERATCVLVPSELYETFGRVIVEAFAKGTPVIASKIGALAEIVQHEQTGLHFEVGNQRDLIDKVTWALAYPERLAAMGQSARTKYEEEYTPKRNHEILMRVYDKAIEGSLSMCHLA